MNMDYPLVKCRFTDENGEPKGREYTYMSKEHLNIGNSVVSENGKSLIVTEINVSPETVCGMENRLKFVSLKQIVEDGPAPESTAISTELSEPLPVFVYMEQDELIIVEQLPIITERLAAVSEEIERRIAEALALDCNEETVKYIKSVRAGLNKEKDAFEEKRRQVKTAVMAPYERFEAVYKENVLDKYKAADAQLKTEIDNVESEVKNRKYVEVKSYFDELCISQNIDFVTLESFNLNVTLTASVKSLKEQLYGHISRVVVDLALIETQEHKEEILVEYRKTLNVSLAIKTVTDRHKAIEEQKARQAEIEARRNAQAEAVKKVDAAIPQPAAMPAQQTTPPLAPPVAVPVTQRPTENTVASPDNDPVMTTTFKVTAPISKLKSLKNFLIEGGYQYE